MLEHLFSPLTLGPVELQNRIVSTGHQTSLVHDHLPTDDFVAYHGARARGGAGLIVLEGDSGASVRAADGAHARRLPARDRRGLPARRRGRAATWDAAVRPAPPRRSRADGLASPGPPALAPSAVPSPRFRVEPRAAQPFAEIDAIVAGHARAAELAAEGGLDGVEISAATAIWSSSSSTRH